MLMLNFVVHDPKRSFGGDEPVFNPALRRSVEPHILDENAI